MSSYYRFGSGSYIERLSNYIVDVSYEDIPDEVMHHAQRVLLDTIGAMLAVSSERFSGVRVITDFIRAMGGKPESTVVGTGFKTSCVNAALVNGTLSYYADIEPTHIGSIVHAAAVVVPSSLAVGERETVDGKHFLTALVVGIDVACRVSRALDPRALYQRGFHPSAVAGCFGAAAAAGFLLQLDQIQFRNAFGLVGTQASGLLAWADDSTENSRPFNLGIAARNGVTAALLAKMGFGGPPDIFEGKYGIFAAFSGAEHLNELTDRLGEKFAVTEMVFKLYACCGLLHPCLDGLLRIADAEALEIEDIAKITLRIAVSGAPIIDRNKLKSHNAQYVLPLALIQRRVSINDVLEDRQMDPRAQMLSGLVSVVGDAELEKTFPDQRGSIVEVVTKTGKRFVEQVVFPKGYPENPLTQAELERKFVELVTPMVPQCQAARTIDLICDIEAVASIGELTDLLRVKEQGTASNSV